MLGEYDNAGFPLAYCLLSTATAIDQGKRTKALSIWAKCLRDGYGIHPIFAHVDKDMAEIGCLKEVWKTKISLCWWHLRRAVRTRLANCKLATTPYNVERACAEYSFINRDFKPAGKKTDPGDYEGGLPEPDMQAAPPACQPQSAVPPPLPSTDPDAANILRIKIPVVKQPPPPPVLSPNPPLSPVPNPPVAPSMANTFTLGRDRVERLMIRVPATQPLVEPSGKPEEEVNSDDETTTGTRRTFCSTLYRDTIITMMEKHFCAHPLIPGYAPPSREGIRRWAVQQMYLFCVENELPEVWAYLWENWYRSGRWNLWARSAHDEIPILKTTMMVEAQ